jgi:hypothetical protein
MFVTLLLLKERTVIVIIVQNFKNVFEVNEKSQLVHVSSHDRLG